MSEEDSVIEYIAEVVESPMSEKSVVPRIKYKGKLSISKRNTKLKTAVSTHIIRKGLSTDQNTPRTIFQLEILADQ